MNGKIQSPLSLPASIWDFKDGENLIYHIELDAKKILFHPTGRKSPYFEDYKKLSAEILFLGIAKRGSTLEQIEKIIIPVNPKIIIPIHFDNFFLDLKDDPSVLLGINYKEWEDTIREKLPKVKIMRPQVAKWLKIAD
jgi:L-ascorbate metabolism protein UlaG (beta-lactamase superfamily)